MGGETAEFFRDLGQRGHEPLLAGVSGRALFEVVDDGRVERWLVVLARGDVEVHRGDGDADCTIRADRAMFDRLCAGEENAIAAVLRGAIRCSGDVELLFAIQRLFPGPARDRTASGREADS
jgi:predicted lipid carrier protein YhbT